MKHKRKQSNDEFLLECIRQNPEDLRDKKMEEELLERIFQKIVDKHFCDDEELMKLNNHKRKKKI